MAKKMRVYEYARQLNMSSKEILTILKRLNIKVSNHMSVMDENMVEQVEQFFKNVKENAARKQQNQNNKPSQAKGQKTSESNKTPQGQKQGGRPNQNRRPKKQGSQNGRGGQKQSASSKDKTKGQDHNRKQQGNKSNVRHHDHHKKNGNRKMNKRKGNATRRQRSAPMKSKTPPTLPKKIEVEGTPTVAELGKLLRRDPAELIKKLIPLGVMATINQSLDVETITLLADEYGVAVEEIHTVDEAAFEEVEEQDDPKDLRERPPVVTIMGHVDHGKTTLLDAIRQSKVTAGEAGGITQHIGAYQVTSDDKAITFLDTPGHSAFTTMRARGAQVTDIAIIVVAADDGVMPQTVEAINHAKAAKVPIIVAINKMDKPDANIDRIKQALTEYELIPEEWGGDTIFVPISALRYEGIDDLLEMVLLVAEVQELKSNPNKRARGTVVEAELNKGRGTVATVLIQHGTLKIGDALVAGNFFGKVRAMVNDHGRRITEAGPSTPVEVLGLNGVPNAGDAFMVFPDEKKARAIAESRAAKQREQDLGTNSKVTLDDLFKQIQEGEIRELPVIIKADVQGSVGALQGSLEKIDIEGVKVKIIHTGVGAITESDVLLASASNAIIIGFNVRPEPNARVSADTEKVDIRLHRIIYNAIDEIEQAMAGLLDPEFVESVIGHAEVRQTFKVSSVGTIAGCYVTDGKVVRDGSARLVRDGVVVHEGQIDTLKRYKDDAKEVAQGYECGMTFQNFNDIKEGDVIEVYIMKEVVPLQKK